MINSNESPRSSALMARLAPLLLLVLTAASCGSSLVTQQEIDEAVADCQREWGDAGKELDGIVKEIARYVSIITGKDATSIDDGLIGACFLGSQGSGGQAERAADCIVGKNDTRRIAGYGIEDYQASTRCHGGEGVGDRMGRLNSCMVDLCGTRSRVNVMDEFAPKFKAAANEKVSKEREFLQRARSRL
jgi:hypothetical protein